MNWIHVHNPETGDFHLFKVSHLIPGNVSNGFLHRKTPQTSGTNKTRQFFCPIEFCPAFDGDVRIVLCQDFLSFGLVIKVTVVILRTEMTEKTGDETSGFRAQTLSAWYQNLQVCKFLWEQIFTDLITPYDSWFTSKKSVHSHRQNIVAS